MSNKDTKKEDVAPVNGAAETEKVAPTAFVAAEPMPVSIQPSDSPGYHEATPWKGNQRWECNDCTADALSEDKMREHVQSHVVRLPKAFFSPPQRTAVDRFGQPLTTATQEKK